MMIELLAGNWVTWSIHVAALLAAGMLGAELFRWRHPQSKLRYFQLLLLVSLLLPVTEPRRTPQATPGTYAAASASAPAATIPPVAAPPVSWQEILMVILPAGMLVRLWLLGLGIWQLRWYRRRGKLLHIEGIVDAEVREVVGLNGPAAFGWLRPVILLPAGLPRGAVRDAALRHELQHVLRRDWLENMIERVAASVLWFHPAVWWLLERIHLAREQAVDAEVAGAGLQRDEYLQALLSAAGLGIRPSLPAAGFVRQPRHFVQRVAFLSKEYPMSFRATAASAACALLMSGAVLTVTNLVLPLQLPAQQTTGESPLNWTRFTPLGEGLVQVEAVVNSEGEVLDARVVSGPDALRKLALQSVLYSRFSKDSAERRTLPVTIDFRKAPAAEGGGLGGVVGGIVGGVPAGVLPKQRPVEQATFEGVDYFGLSPELQQRAAGVMASLHSGQKVNQAQIDQLRRDLAAIDSSLRLGMAMRDMGDGKGDILRLNVNLERARPPQQIRVGTFVQDQNLIHRVDPVYPPLARQARIQGTVRFNITISKDGAVQQMQLVSGHPLLVESAREAVAQYKYKATMLDGEPVTVQTMVDVNFVL